jgi:hypothetical protein
MHTPTLNLSTTAALLALLAALPLHSAQAADPAAPATPPATAPAAAAPGVTAAMLQRDAATANKGFSYFIGLAHQDVRYSETGGSLPFKSSAHSGSALLVTGALFAVNQQLLVSLDAETTFYPGQATERWQATGDSFNGQVLSNRELQHNGFGLSHSRTQMLGHYRVQDQFFGLAGLALHTQAFRRYGFVPGPDNAVNTPPGTTVDESTAEVLLNLGLGLETEQVRDRPEHYGLRATVGVPVWRRLRNTNAPQLVFDGRNGYDLGLEGRYSRALQHNIHLGVWGQWLLSQRGRQTLGALEMPTARTNSLSYGLELLWKL